MRLRHFVMKNSSNINILFQWLNSLARQLKWPNYKLETTFPPTTPIRKVCVR